MNEEIVGFGKHKGERWTRVPISYLRWLIDVGSQWAEHAKRELERRGTVLEHEIKLTGHAIDRFYLRYSKSGLQRSDIKEMGGIYSALYKLSADALKQANGAEKVKWKGMEYVFSYGELDTTLVTVM